MAEYKIAMVVNNNAQEVKIEADAWSIEDGTLMFFVDGCLSKAVAPGYWIGVERGKTD